MLVLDILLENCYALHITNILHCRALAQLFIRTTNQKALTVRLRGGNY